MLRAGDPAGQRLWNDLMMSGTAITGMMTNSMSGMRPLTSVPTVMANTTRTAVTR